jgi:hypothetical protein
MRKTLSLDYNAASTGSATSIYRPLSNTHDVLGIETCPEQLPDSLERSRRVVEMCFDRLSYQYLTNI